MPLNERQIEVVGKNQIPEVALFLNIFKEAKETGSASVSTGAGDHIKSKSSNAGDHAREED